MHACATETTVTISLLTDCQLTSSPKSSDISCTMQNSIIFLFLAISASSVLGFNAIKSSSTFQRLKSRSNVKMAIFETASTLLDGSSTLLLNFLQRVDPEQAKGEFFFFFFGGSGALGIGAAQVPKIAAELNGTVSCL